MSRETASRPPTLPPSLARRLDGCRWHRNHVGQAGAAVYRLHRAGAPNRYLKLTSGAAAQALADEFARHRWLAGQMAAVARLEHFESTGHRAWLLTRAVPGRTAHEWLTDAPARAPRIVAALARFLANLHALPAGTCPFNAHHTLRLAEARRRLDAGLVDASDFDAARSGWTPQQVWDELHRLLPLAEDPVVTHGDCSLDNVLLDGAGRVRGVIDLGRLGVADRYQDLAILWNDLAAFGADAQHALFAEYGIAQPDRRRLDFHLCLDECF